MLTKQRRAQETPEETERRKPADAARKASVRASQLYEETERRKKEDAQRKSACRAAMSKEEKQQRRLENAKWIAALRASLPKEEKEKKVRNKKTVAVLRAKTELREPTQLESMAATNQAWSEKGIISFPFYPIINYESNPSIQIHFAQNQQLYQQNAWSTLMPNTIPAIFPSYTVKENAVIPTNVETPPPEIIETKTIIKSPEELFGFKRSNQLKKRGRKPGTKKHVPAKKMRLWEWAEKSKNGRGVQSNNSTVKVLSQKSVQIKMNYLIESSKQFDEHVEKLKNGYKYQLENGYDQPKSFTSGLLPEKAEAVQIKMNYLIDSSKQFENVEKLENSSEGQLNSSTAGVLPEKDENVQIKMEYLLDSSEQLEKVEKLNDSGGQPGSLSAEIHPDKVNTVHIKMEHLADSSEQLGKVQNLNDCERQPDSSTAGVPPEKDENVQIEMEFAVDPSEQLGNVEPWNMFTLELSTPNMNVETQNDVATSMPVNSSITETSDPPDKCDKTPVSFHHVSMLNDVATSMPVNSSITETSDPSDKCDKTPVSFHHVSMLNDVTASMPVNSSIPETSDPSDKCYKTPVSFHHMCSNIAVNAVNNAELLSPISLNTDTQSLVQEIQVLKAKNVFYAIENETLKKKLKNLEKAYEDSKKDHECMQQQIQEFVKNNRGMSNAILEIEKHNKALSAKLVELQNEKNVLTNKVCDLEKQNEY